VSRRDQPLGARQLRSPSPVSGGPRDGMDEMAPLPTRAMVPFPGQQVTLRTSAVFVVAIAHAPSLAGQSSPGQHSGSCWPGGTRFNHEQIGFLHRRPSPVDFAVRYRVPLSKGLDDQIAVERSIALIGTGEFRGEATSAWGTTCRRERTGCAR
jgi:hypothetical protein